MSTRAEAESERPGLTEETATLDASAGDGGLSERRIVVTISGAHALIHATELAYAALLLRIEAEFGTDLLLLGVLANVGGFAFGLAALPSGFLVDRLGSVRVLQLTLAGASVAALLVALSPSEIVLGVTLALLGLTTGLYHPAGFALLARTKRRTRNVGLHGVIGNLGVAVAPVLLSGIALASDWRVAYVTLSALAVVGLLYALRLPRGGALSMGPGLGSPEAGVADAGAWDVGDGVAGPEPAGAGRPTAGSGPAAARRRVARLWWIPLAVVYLANVIQGFVYRGSVTFIPTHIEEQITGSLLGVSGTGLAGALTTVALLGGALGWYVGGILADRLPRYPLVMATWMATVPMLLAISASDGGLLILVTFIFVVTNFAMAPALVTLIADYSPPGRMGSSFGVMFFLSFGLGSFAATLAGFTAEEWGIDAVFLVLAVVNGGGALLSGSVFFLTRASHRQPGAYAASP